MSVFAKRWDTIVSCVTRLPILFPLDTSSRVYREATLGLLFNSGTQSLTGLKLILRYDIDSRVPSLPICIASIELTRLKDIVARLPAQGNPGTSTIGPYFLVCVFSAANVTSVTQSA